MRKVARWKLAGVLGALALSVAVALPKVVAKNVALGGRDFDFSSDPERLLLQVRYHGGQTGANDQYRLFADGRLLCDLINTNAEILETRFVLLSHDQAEALLRGLVDAGLMEQTTASLRSKMALAGGNVIIRSHGGGMSVDLSLPAYKGPQADDFEAAVARFSVANPADAARRHPGVPELDALARLGNQLREHSIADEKKREGQ